MSKTYVSKEEGINQLYATIKSKFEQDGVLQEMRCMLQAKMVSMMKGTNDSSALMIPSFKDDGQRESRIELLHQLIMEYFHWHGFHYSAEMFATESATDNSRPVRECLEGVLGTFEHKEIPILLELVAELMLQRNNRQGNS